MLAGDDLRQVDRKAEGVVEREDLGARDRAITLAPQALELVLQDAEAAIEGGAEALLLFEGDLADEARPLLELRVGAGHPRDDRLAHPVHEGLVDAEALAVA